MLESVIAAGLGGLSWGAISPAHKMADSTITKENVLLAIKVLYDGPSDQQSAASSWLNTVTNAAQAWHIAWALLGEPCSVEVHFFAANMLLTKVRHDWKRLAPNDQTSLISSVRCCPLTPAEQVPGFVLTGACMV